METLLSQTAPFAAAFLMALTSFSLLYLVCWRICRDVAMALPMFVGFSAVKLCALHWVLKGIPV